MKKILFVASREPSYSRVEHFKNSLNSHFESVESCIFEHKSYVVRLLKVLYLFYRQASFMNFDVLVLGFCAQILVFPVALVYRGRLVIDGFVSLYDTLVLDRKVFSKNGLIARLILYLEQTVLSYGDLITVDTEQHKLFFIQILKVPEYKVRVLPVTAQEEKFQPQQLEKTGAFQILFFGTFLPLQGVDIIAESILKLRDSDISFILVGEGFERQKIEKKLQGAENVTFEKWLSLSELSERINQADLVLGVFGKSEKTDRVIPNKLVISAYHGKAILTLKTTAVMQEFIEAESIFYVNEPDEVELANKIQDLYKNRHLLAQVGQGALAVYQDRFSYGKTGKLLAEYIQKLPRIGLIV